MSPYYALDDPIVEQRATRSLAPPSGVKLRVNDGVLHVEGAAPLAWIKNLPSRALLLPGIRSVDLSGPNSPEQIALNVAKGEIESTVIKFPVASSVLSGKEREVVNTVVVKLKEVLSSSSAAQGMIVTIIGHSDSTGAELTNVTLSQQRAERVAAEMVHLGVADKKLKAAGVSTTEPLRSEDSEENRQYNRSVTFRISSALP